MPLAQASLSVTLTTSFTYSLAPGPFGIISQGPNTAQYNLPNLDLSVYDQAVEEYFALAGGQFFDIDLYDFVNLIAEETGLRHAITLLILPAAGYQETGAKILCEAAPSNGWYLGDLSDRNTIQSGGCLLLSAGEGLGGTEGSGMPVSPTQRYLRVTNVAGSGGTGGGGTAPAGGDQAIPILVVVLGGSS